MASRNFFFVNADFRNGPFQMDVKRNFRIITKNHAADIRAAGTHALGLPDSQGVNSLISDLF